MKKTIGFAVFGLCFGFSVPHVAVGDEAMTSPPQHKVIVQVEYKNIQYKLGSFGMVLTGPANLMASEPDCVYQSRGAGDFGYNRNKITLGGFSDYGVASGILMECTFTMDSLPTVSDFSLRLQSLTDTDRQPLTNIFEKNDFLITVK